MSDETLITLTADIVSAHVGSNNVAVADLPKLIESVHAALSGLGQAAEPAADAASFAPAVSVRKSLSDPAKIISLIDGKPYSTLKRHLAVHGLTPTEYRARYNLPASYPMTAPAYTEARRAIAKKLGLGRKPKAAAPEAAAAPAKAPRAAKGKAAPAPVAEAPAKAPRGRKPKAAAAAPAPSIEAPVKAPRKRLGISAAKAAAK